MRTVEDRVADLLARGYVEIPEFEGLRPGARVRHRGEQYARAHLEGTATVRYVFRKDPSSWAQTYRRPDVEIVAERDDTEIGPMFVADYHVDLVGSATTGEDHPDNRQEWKP